MTTLTAIGLGYCARQLLAGPHPFTRVIGTGRGADAGGWPQGVERHVFDGRSLSPALAAALAETDILLHSVPPDDAGDPVLDVAGPALAGGRLKQIIYLTTLGVYGDHDGGWVDETTPPVATSPRLARRIRAEAALMAFGERNGITVAALRLAGIYGPGPGRNPLRQMAEGRPTCIDKPGQVFNRIHVADIAAAILAVAGQGFSGVLNVADDLPAPSCEPLRFAADLLGLPPPEVVPFEIARRDMNPMALSFWASNKRVSNARLKGLGVALRYPTYREGLAALAAAGEGGPRRPQGLDACQGRL